MKKRIFTLMLSVFFVLSLAACGKVRRNTDAEFAPKGNGYRKICRTVDMVNFT